MARKAVHFSDMTEGAKLAYLIATRCGASLAGRDPEVIRDAFVMLTRDAVRWATLACNREMTPGEKRKDAATDLAIHALAGSIGCKAILSGDPRGCVVHLGFPLLPGETQPPHNTWGGAENGWGVIPGSRR